MQVFERYLFKLVLQQVRVGTKMAGGDGSLLKASLASPLLSRPPNPLSSFLWHKAAQLFMNVSSVLPALSIFPSLSVSPSLSLLASLFLPHSLSPSLSSLSVQRKSDCK